MKYIITRVKCEMYGGTVFVCHEWNANEFRLCTNMRVECISSENSDEEREFLVKNVFVENANKHFAYIRVCRG